MPQQPSRLSRALFFAASALSVLVSALGLWIRSRPLELVVIDEDLHIYETRRVWFPRPVPDTPLPEPQRETLGRFPLPTGDLWLFEETDWEAQDPRPRRMLRMVTDGETLWERPTDGVLWIEPLPTGFLAAELAPGVGVGVAAYGADGGQQWGWPPAPMEPAWTPRGILLRGPGGIELRTWSDGAGCRGRTEHTEVLAELPHWLGSAACAGSICGRYGGEDLVIDGSAVELGASRWDLGTPVWPARSVVSPIPGDHTPGAGEAMRYVPVASRESDETLWLDLEEHRVAARSAPASFLVVPGAYLVQVGVTVYRVDGSTLEVTALADAVPLHRSQLRGAVLSTALPGGPLRPLDLEIDGPGGPARAASFFLK